MIIDNKQKLNKKYDIVTVWDFIEKYTKNGNLDIVTGFFTLPAIDRIHCFDPNPSEYRLILSKIAGENEKAEKTINLIQGKMNLSNAFSTNKTAKSVIDFFKQDNVSIKTIDGNFCHAKTYIYNDPNPDNSYYLTGSSNLTESGLGIYQSSNIEINIAERNADNKNFDALSDWFTKTWNDTAQDKITVTENGQKIQKDVKQYFIDYISRLYKNYSPKEIYFKILFELFKNDINNLLADARGLKRLEDSQIWKTLFEYQRRGVKSLINMLSKYNGAILADAVGLGKTFTALAVMKHFQNEGYAVLVLCPKKLEQNWTQYKYLAGSKFENDALHFVVKFHTDLQDDRMDKSNEKITALLRTHRKVLIVIDESHNLRNDKSSRYDYLLKNILQQYPDTDFKILELSATPINTKIADVRNQIKLFVRGNDKGFDIEDFDYINSLAGVFASAQKKIAKWQDGNDHSVKELIRLLPDKFFNLTDKLVIARTRAMIERNSNENLGFPHKNKPENLFVTINKLGNLNGFLEIYQALTATNLSAYMPSFFTKPVKAKSAIEDKPQREFYLAKMLMVLFVKRLESSWFACRKTMQGVLDYHINALRKIVDYQENNTDAPLNMDDAELEKYFDSIDVDSDTEPSKQPVFISDIVDLDKYKKSIENDIKALKNFVDNINIFYNDFQNQKATDNKLDSLKKVLNQKVNKEGGKVLVFTTYSDTAEYLYQNLEKAFPGKVAMVSGNGAIYKGKREANFMDTLRRFAPMSKMYNEFDWTDEYKDYFGTIEKEHFDVQNNKWIVSFDEWKQMVMETKDRNPRTRNFNRLLEQNVDILIGTDCISEGQNLQDAKTVINYDIHWNPVRIIQRIGRIDRLKSPNQSIDCVNYWPSPDYDSYLRLYSRIEERLIAMALVGAEIPNLTESLTENIKDNPIINQNEQKLLEQLKEDLSADDADTRGFGLEDLSLESFRQELLAFLGDEKRKELENMPLGIFSGFISKDKEQLPESLLALVGSPCKSESGENHEYKNLKLILRPLNRERNSTVMEFNRKDILYILRTYKNAERVVSPKIDNGDPDELDFLKNVLIGGMKQGEAKKELLNTLINLTNKSVAALPPEPLLIEEKLNPEKWDLLAWDIISVQ